MPSPSEEQARRQLRQYRNRERLLGLALGFAAFGSSAMYVVFLRGQLALPWIITMIAIEWLIMAVIYLLIVSTMRRRRR